MAVNKTAPIDNTRRQNTIDLLRNNIFRLKGRGKAFKLIVTTFIAHWLLRLIFCAICYGLCLCQVIDVFTKYYTFPAEVNVIVEEMKDIHLPAITICNNNIILRSKLTETYPEVNQINDSLKFKDFVNKLLKNVSLKNLLEYTQTAEEFIRDMGCDAKNSSTESCKVLPAIPSLQRNGICFTYFHRMAKSMRSQSNNSKPLHTKPKILNEYSDDIELDSNEIAHFMLDFQPDQYTDLEQPISGRLSIAQNLEISNSLSNGYIIEPGNTYIVYISRKTTELLPPPYQTACFDYYRNNSMHLKASGDFSVPLTRNQCAAVCASMYSIGYCKCWPPELPYIKNNKLERNESLKWCDWRNRDDIELRNICYNKLARIKCSLLCQPNCVTDNFDVYMQKMPYPYKKYEYYTLDDNETRKCCARVSIRYWSTERTIHLYSEKFTFVFMVCYVGGLVSMYIGISFITIYDLLLIIVNKLFAIYKKYIIRNKFN